MDENNSPALRIWVPITEFDGKTSYWVMGCLRERCREEDQYVEYMLTSEVERLYTRKPVEGIIPYIPGE